MNALVNNYTYPVVIVSFIIMNVHILRNLSPIYFVALGIPPAIAFSNMIYRKKFKTGILPIDIYLLCLVYISAISVLWLINDSFYTSASEVLVGIVRLWFAVPLLFLVMNKSWRDEEFQTLIRIHAIFSAIGVLSIPLQFLLESPIPWFAEPSIRMGVPRYASFFGSLTTIGTVGSLGITSTLFSGFSKKVKTILIATILLGLVMSLQKAVIANIVVCFTSYLFFECRNLKAAAKKIFSNIPLGLGVIITVFTIAYSINKDAPAVTIGLFRFSNSIASQNAERNLITLNRSFNEDQPVPSSLYARLVSLPLKAFDAYPSTSLILGVGVIGSSGVLGMPNAPMSHNNFADLLLMGGFFIGATAILSLLWFFLKVLCIRVKTNTSIRANNVNFAKGFVVFVFINMLAASGVVVHPTTTSIMFLVMGIMATSYFQVDESGA